MSAPLLTTKLAIPPLREGLLSRPRLIERLDEGTRSAHKLTLVSAPAGYGKTTLLCEWIGSGVRSKEYGVEGERELADGKPPSFRAASLSPTSYSLLPAQRPSFCWLSLDEGDNDPARFFGYLVAALQTVDPAIGRSVQAMQQASQPPPPEALLTALLNDVAAAPGPFVLVLDDYHLIHTLPIHQQLAFLIAHQPSNLHLVIATREDPPLPLSRLRVRRQMVELREADLRFTAQETADFFRSMSIELSSEHIAALQRRTEGWIAGLQLVALSMRGSTDVQSVVHSFTGSHRYVLDYLIDEVFEQQPEQIQDFLLQTSILDRLTAPLCDAVIGEGEKGKGEAGSLPLGDAATRSLSGSQGVLERLEHANLFLVPLDESRLWYRYHHLFASLLRHRLESASRYDVAQLHRRASRWYADNGLPADAIGHALAAQDWSVALELILGGLEEVLLKRGQVATLLGWYGALPGDLLRANPRACIAYSWPLILADQIDDAEPYLALAERAAQAKEDKSLLGEVTLARVYIARMRGDHQQALLLSEQALALLPQGDLNSRSIVAINLGIAQWFRGRLAEAEEALVEAERAGRGSGNDYARYAACTFLCRILAARGNLRQAVASCREQIRHSGELPIGCLAHFNLGRLLYEWNDLDPAAEHLQRGIELARQSGSVEFVLGGTSSLALVEQARGNTSAARAALRAANEIVESADIPPPTQMAHLATRIAYALAQGDLASAAVAVGQIPEPEQAGSFPDYMSLMLLRARFLMATGPGQRVAAAGQLAAVQGMASQAGWQSVVVQARALQALTAPTPGEARTVLAEALALAVPEGYIRTFVDAGEPMEKLLAALVQEPSAANGNYARKLLDAFRVPSPSAAHPHPEPVEATQRSRREGGTSPQLATLQPATLVEPLSDREIDVLRLLGDGQANQEIALALCVSINTVKTHLKNIYSKLEVGNRRRAVARARELGLLPGRERP